MTEYVIFHEPDGSGKVGEYDDDTRAAMEIQREDRICYLPLRGDHVEKIGGIFAVNNDAIQIAVDSDISGWDREKVDPMWFKDHYNRRSQAQEHVHVGDMGNLFIVFITLFGVNIRRYMDPQGNVLTVYE